MEAAEASAAACVYDALPGLTLDFSPEEEALDVAAAQSSSAAAAEGDATATYAVFRNEITAAGDTLADIPVADFFSLDVSAVVRTELASPLSPALLAAAAATTPSSSRAPAEQPAQGSERAWFRGGRRFRSPMLQLHEEIIDFCDFIPPSAEEQSSRTVAVQAVSNVIKHIWPHGKVEIFESFRRGLYLQVISMQGFFFFPTHLWISAVVFESRVKTPQVGLYALAKALSQKGVAKKIQVIAKAHVPIVKFVERNSGIPFDIRLHFIFSFSYTNIQSFFFYSAANTFFPPFSSFDIDGGPQAADFIKDAVKRMPALRALCMILKVFLHQRELNEVYTGGIGSYALLTMLITQLQLIWGAKDMLGYRQSKEHNLGFGQVFRFLWTQVEQLGCWNILQLCKNLFLEE